MLLNFTIFRSIWHCKRARLGRFKLVELHLQVGWPALQLPELARRWAILVFMVLPMYCKGSTALPLPCVYYRKHHHASITKYGAKSQWHLDSIY